VVNSTGKAAMRILIFPPNKANTPKTQKSKKIIPTIIKRDILSGSLFI